MPQTRHQLQPRSRPALLSLVIPAYNEEAMVPVLRRELTAFYETLGNPVELLFIDDGSSDHTLQLLRDWASAAAQVKVIGLARNFGHQAAVTAGLDLARGDAVVIIDADLQDPLDVIPAMIEKYCQGYDVVYGQRIKRNGEGLFKRLTAWTFYRLMRRFIHRELPADAGDFRLISRPCLEALRSMRETHRFLRGMVAWVGFAQTPVMFQRRPRVAGESKYPFWKMVRFAWTAAVSFSPAPLRVSLSGGFAVALIGVAVAIYAVLRKFLIHDTIQGWTSVIALICLIGGAILMSVGVLGEYVGRIFEESKGRPLYLVSSTANVAPDQKPASGIFLNSPL